MTEQNQPGIRFSLEEAVWFRSSEEIAELISLSLEPNITIQDQDQFVSIRGALKMFGEYKKDERRDREEDQHYYFSGQKFVTVLDSRESDVSEFHYAFPVDITVPKARVKNFEDLNVVIDTFDYIIPDPSCLKLTTDVQVTGVEADNAAVYERNDIVEESEDFEEVIVENRFVPLREETNNEEAQNELTFTAEATKVEERNEEEHIDTEIPISIAPSSNDQFEEISQSDRTDEEDDLQEIPTFHTNFEQTLNQPITDDSVLSFERIPSDETENAEELTTFKFLPAEKKEMVNHFNEDKREEQPIHELLAKSVDDEEVAEVEKVTEKPTLTFVRDEINEELESVDDANLTEQVQEHESVNDADLTERVQEQVVVSLERDHEDEDTKTSEEQVLRQISDEEEQDTAVEQLALLRNQENLEEADELNHIENNIIDLEEARTEKNINYQTQTQRDEASISLTEFLARKDENPLTQMKVYIVQDQDNLNVISEKYKVSVSQLLRINQLEPHQDVYEGQVLYIPTKQRKHS